MKVIQPYQSAWAVLNIVLNFFEMIAEYQDGSVVRKSKFYFKEGVKSVFQELNLHPKLRDTLDDSVRCGLYNFGYTSLSVFIGDNVLAAISLTKYGRVIINPQILVAKVREYFGEYVQRLQDADNIKLRKNFEIRFDFSNLVQRKIGERAHTQKIVISALNSYNKSIA